MSYWWASQNKNYRSAIPNGTLWTRPRVNGVLPRERQALQELALDDVIFHYGSPFVRAVSRVVASAIDWERPSDYPRGPRETAANDDGKLVRVEVIEDDLRLHRDRVKELIQWGVPGPLTRDGVPREAYLSQLHDSDAQALFAELGIEVPTRSLPGRPHENWAGGAGATDVDAVARIRIEQAGLRAHLLAGRSLANCALCGREFNEEFLVAGHIVPRAELSEEERWQFDANAMLVCLLGCDALFEHGYLAVDNAGIVATGRPAPVESVDTEVRKRIGRTSTAWNGHTAPAFENHFHRNN